MKVYKNKLIYEIEFLSLDKPELYNPENIKLTLKKMLMTNNFTVGADKLIIDSKQEEL